MNFKTISPTHSFRNIKYINKVANDLENKIGLLKVELPMFITKQSCLNDGLNGEEPVIFKVQDESKEVVQSHAKLKRAYINKYTDNFSSFTYINDNNTISTSSISKSKIDKNYNGIFTDMHAIRKHETMDNTHHFSVRQLDFCVKVNKESNNNKLYVVIQFLNVLIPCLNLDTNEYGMYSSLDFFLNYKDIINNDNLDELKKEYELELSKKHKIFVITKIGSPVFNGMSYDYRSADYDDHEANGDIYVTHPTLGPIEICSFGYRVNKDSLIRQLDRLNIKEDDYTDYHKEIINNDMVQTIGGGLGIDRLLMVKFDYDSVHETNPN